MRASTAVHIILRLAWNKIVYGNFIGNYSIPTEVPRKKIAFKMGLSVFHWSRC